MNKILALISGILAAIVAIFIKGESTAKTEEKLKNDEEVIDILETQKRNAEYTHNLSDDELNDELSSFIKKK